MNVFDDADDLPAVRAGERDDLAECAFWKEALRK